MDNFTGSPTPTVSWMKDVEPISSVQYDPRITINATGSLRIESKKIFLFAILSNPVNGWAQFHVPESRFFVYILFHSIVNCLYLVRGGVEAMKKLGSDLSVQAKELARAGIFPLTCVLLIK